LGSRRWRHSPRPVPPRARTDRPGKQRRARRRTLWMRPAGGSERPMWRDGDTPPARARSPQEPHRFPMLAVSDHPNLSLPGKSVARAGEDETLLEPGGDSPQLTRTMRLVPGDHLPRWQAASRGAPAGDIRMASPRHSVIRTTEAKQYALAAGQEASVELHDHRSSDGGGPGSAPAHQALMPVSSS
jgi:hypothetical protein